MITVLNRKEICITHDIQEQMRIRDALRSHNIKYILRTRFASAHSFRRGITVGMNEQQMYEYKIYVHKKDYEAALYAIKK